MAQATQALSVLHSMAASPRTASDALTLLHELQVHQLELDMQAQEMHEAREELEAALQRQAALFNSLPVGCFTISAQLIVQELNRTGADMLGIEPEQARGVPLSAFVSTESAARLRSSLTRHDDNTWRPSFPMTLLNRAGVERRVHASVAADLETDSYAVSFMNVGSEASW